MFLVGMSDLLAAMLAAGGPSCIDAREHRHLHAALVGLGKDGLRGAAFPSLDGRPDPDVGLRVSGVTPALWDLVGAGLLRVLERPGGADLMVEGAALPSGRRVLMRLRPTEQAAIYRAAGYWAAASTQRKNPASAASSPGGTWRSSDLNCRQVVVPARRQRAVRSIAPA